MEKKLQYLSDLTWGYRASRILQTAVKLKLFTHLSGEPLTLKQLADLSGAKPDVLEKVLIACCAMQLLSTRDGLYENTEISDEYLVENKPLYQGNIIAHASNVWDFWNDLPNEILKDTAEENPESSHKNFILGMHNITMAGRGRIFIDNIDLSGRKKLFDVGGGPGTYSILACKKYPELNAVVFDLPETIAIAKQVVANEGLQDRITFETGSWETSDFDDDNDVVLLSNILHGAASMAKMKLEKAYRSLVSRGRVIIQEFVLNNSKTGPLIPALFNVMVGAYSADELFEKLTDAGFVDPKIIATDGDIGCTWIIADKK